MPRINRDHRTATAEYRTLAEKSMALNENNDCVVKAIVLTTGASYEQVHSLCLKFGRKPGRGTDMHRTARLVLRALGFTYKVWGYYPQFHVIQGVQPWERSLHRVINSYPGKHKNLLHCTTHHPVRFAKAWEFARGRNFIALTSSWRHAAAICDGQVHDWSRGRALRIDCLWEIVPLRKGG